MDYYEQDERRSRIWGIIGVVLYLVLCAGLMLVTYRISLPEPETGILIDFGTSDTGGGEVDLALSQQDAAPVSSQPQTPPSEPVVTSELPDAPEVVPEPEHIETPPQPTTPEPEPEPVRQVNPNALFPGRTEGSTSTSQGSSEGAGNQGLQDGAPDGSDSEGGAGVEGFSLVGRDKIGELPSPIQGENLSGRVVIRINVNREGKVISATYEQRNSTTNLGELVKAAREAALKARFTPSENEIQTGTITYIFRLN